MPSDPESDALQQRLNALVKDTDATETKATAARRRVQVARLLLEEEQAAAADLERKAAAAKGLLPSSSSSSTTSDMVNGATYDSALATNLHIQATNLHVFSMCLFAELFYNSVLLRSSGSTLSSSASLPT
jgi:hypothetical protein